MSVSLRQLMLAFAVSGVLACSTDPSNSYGSGGSTGSIQVRDSVTGTPSGVAFTISVGSVTKPIATNGVVSFTGVTPGDYAVNFGGTLGNCAVSGGSSQAVTVLPGYIEYLTFITACT
ncbi:MAG: hypothetical protein WBC97_06550 [Gemmatimonadales bacterium]